MKTIYLTLILLFTTISNNAQVPVVEVDINTYTDYPAPIGTYLKDISHTFDSFLGTWKYQNGNEILIIKLEKVEQYLDAEYGTYEDFIKGNYSYSTDNGVTFVVNTIQQNLGINNPSQNSMYSCMPRNSSTIFFRFTDIVYQKNAWANFTFQNSNYQQLHLKLENKGGGYIYPAIPPNPAFCIPNNVVLIKQ